VLIVNYESIRNSRLIVFRYLAREVLLTTLAVTAVLLLIITSTHLIGYLADAASGEIATSVVLSLVFNRIPLFLELLLPLGFFLGILLAYGRLYLDSEMVVLKACGTGSWRLIAFTYGPALLISVCVAFVSLYLTPTGMYEAKRIVAEQRARTELDMLVPGTFQTQASKNQVTYTRNIDQAGMLEELFVSGVDKSGSPYLLIAKEGEQRFLETNGRFLVFKEGYRYDFNDQGVLDQELAYGEYAVQLPEPKLTAPIRHLDAIPTLELFGSDRPDLVSRLHWRTSLPFLPLVLVFLAVQLARTSPRQGRYAKLIPAIILYQVYVGSLTAARSVVEQGAQSGLLIWFVHFVALAVGVSMVLFEGGWERLMNRLPALPSFKVSRSKGGI
jgi:lipopolysaccharide export system permease protein